MLCCLHKLFYKKCPKNHIFANHKKNNDVKTKKNRNHGKSIFLGPIFEMHLDLFFDQNLRFFNVQTETNKNGVNLINIRASETLERQ